MESIRDGVNVLSLALSWPTIVLGAAVVLIWGKKAWETFCKPAKQRAAEEWLILGVAVGFCGSVIDNQYWGIAWSLDLVQHKARDWAFDHGVYFNVPFRQIAGIYAAYCHLRSFYLFNYQEKKLGLSEPNFVKHTTGKRTVFLILLCSVALGIIYVTALLGSGLAWGHME